MVVRHDIDDYERTAERADDDSVLLEVRCGIAAIAHLVDEMVKSHNLSDKRAQQIIKKCGFDVAEKGGVLFTHHRLLI